MVNSSLIPQERVPRICIGWNRIHTPTANKSVTSSAQGARAFRFGASRLPGRKTRCRLLARLYRVGSMTHWVPPKGFFDASYTAFLLSQAFLAQARFGPIDEWR
jgi:hypothetical protein